MEWFNSMVQQIIENRIEDGGLQYPNIRQIDATMKVSWFKRLYNLGVGWASVPNSFGMDNIYIYGELYQKKLLTNITNIFRKDTIKALLLINKHQIFHGTESLLTIPFWYNSQIITGINLNWVEKGLRTINDLMDWRW